MASAVSNTGPILHLTEINTVRALALFSPISIPSEVAHELTKQKVTLPRFIKCLILSGEAKDTTKIFTNEYNLDSGEAEAIALALQQKVDHFLTDDLAARQVAAAFNLNVHGTVGILLRAYRNKLLDKKKAIEKVKALKTGSSLFITQDLIYEILQAINNFKH